VNVALAGEDSISLAVPAFTIAALIRYCVPGGDTGPVVQPERYWRISRTIVKLPSGATTVLELRARRSPFAPA